MGPLKLITFLLVELSRWGVGHDELTMASCTNFYCPLKTPKVREEKPRVEDYTFEPEILCNKDDCGDLPGAVLGKSRDSRARHRRVFCMQSMCSFTELRISFPAGEFCPLSVYSTNSMFGFFPG
uniref:Secreted protein n=1 Tax=Micrurus lemniscatus lemniscatus TaxID=129467 RepID=A0A2D4JBC7_MICLE